MGLCQPGCKRKQYCALFGKALAPAKQRNGKGGDDESVIWKPYVKNDVNSSFLGEGVVVRKRGRYVGVWNVIVFPWQNSIRVVIVLCRLEQSACSMKKSSVAICSIFVKA